MTNKQWHPHDLQSVFPEIPESASRALMNAAGSLKEESDMKIRHSLRLALVLAVVIISMLGVALAAFYPKITAFFGEHFGKDFQVWLEEGEVAAPENAIVVEGVTFTLNEVAYRNHGLYGMGTITPGEGVVLLGVDCFPEDAYGYNVHYGDKAPEGTPTILEKAQQDGSTIKHVEFYLEKIGVDGGALLVPGSWGSGMYPQRDGSMQFMFEVSDGQVVSEGETYTIVLTACVRPTSPEGEVDYDHPVYQEWTVEIQPEPFSEVAGTPAADPAAPDPTVAPAVESAEVQLVVPAAYTENGTLPVYKATERDFSNTLDYAWFNQSGVAQEQLYTRSIGGSVDYNDGGHLDWSSYTLFYHINDGTYEAVGELEDGTPVTSVLSRRALVSDVCSIAGWMTFGFPGTDEIYTLESTQLETISLDEAKAQAEALMAKLGMPGYTCTTALDMGVDRIHQMGALYNAAIDSGALSTNAYRYDYSTATTAEEGYYLIYHRFGSDSAIAGQFEAVFYVTADGIKEINLRDAYVQGEVLRTPERLVEAQTVIEALPGEMADSRCPEKLTQVKRATLTWMPVRDQKSDGMVMTPVWVLAFLTEESYQQGYEGWAVFDAATGKLISAIFN